MFVPAYQSSRRNAGSISHEIGKENAEREYKKFKENKQKTISDGDFEKAINKIDNKMDRFS